MRLPLCNPRPCLRPRSQILNHSQVDASRHCHPYGYLPNAGQLEDSVASRLGILCRLNQMCQALLLLAVPVLGLRQDLLPFVLKGTEGKGA